METSVKNDPVYLISNYSRVKSSNYMIYKMLENATPENIDSYRQLIVALPEFQEGINTSSDKRNVLRYNKSIETILKNEKLIFNLLDNDLNKKLKTIINNENKDKLGLKDINNIDDINFKYNTYINSTDGTKEDRVILNNKLSHNNMNDNFDAILNSNNSYTIKKIAELRGEILNKEQNLEYDPNSYSDEQKAQDLYKLIMMNKYLDESSLEVENNKITSKHHKEKTIDYRNQDAKQKQELITNFSDRMNKSIENSKDNDFKARKKQEINSLDTKDELEENIEKSRLDDDFFDK
jgi:hypothetical protein